jgi:hypothetical protein
VLPDHLVDPRALADGVHVLPPDEPCHGERV